MIYCKNIIFCYIYIRVLFTKFINCLSFSNIIITSIIYYNNTIKTLDIYFENFNFPIIITRKSKIVGCIFRSSIPATGPAT